MDSEKLNSEKLDSEKLDSGESRNTKKKISETVSLINETIDRK